jgi:hypothetical protein
LRKHWRTRAAAALTGSPQRRTFPDRSQPAGPSLSPSPQRDGRTPPNSRFRWETFRLPMPARHVPIPHQARKDRARRNHFRSPQRPEAGLRPPPRMADPGSRLPPRAADRRSRLPPMGAAHSRRADRGQRTIPVDRQAGRRRAAVRPWPCWKRR